MKDKCKIIYAIAFDSTEFVNCTDINDGNYYNKFTDNFLARVTKSKDKYFLEIHIPHKIKGILRAMLFKYVLGRLSATFESSKFIEKTEMNFYEYDADNDDDRYILQVTKLDVLVNTFEHCLGKLNKSLYSSINTFEEMQKDL